MLSVLFFVAFIFIISVQGFSKTLVKNASVFELDLRPITKLHDRFCNGTLDLIQTNREKTAARVRAASAEIYIGGGDAIAVTCGSPHQTKIRPCYMTYKHVS